MPAARKPRRSGRAKVHQDTAAGYFAALADRDVATATTFWHPDGVDDFVAVGIFRGPAAIGRFLGELFAAFPDLEMLAESLIADTTGAAVRWRLRGTFDGAPFLGYQPTGRWVELRGCDCLEMDEDGKIVRNTAYYDGAGFARGIGLLPPQDGGAERALRAGFNAVTRVRAAAARRTGEAS